MQIEDLGWDRYHHIIENLNVSDLHNIGRIAVEHKQSLLIYTDSGEIEGLVPRKLVHRSNPLNLPKVGDWVVFERLPGENKAVISEVLPRYTVLSRKEVGKKTKEQVIATNIDTVFIVMGFDDNFNLSRLERYLLLVAASGAEPIIILNKSDLVDNPTSKTSLARTHAKGTPIISISAKLNSGLEAIARAIKPDDTVVFVGSSGVGKSSIINALLGEDRQTVAETRISDSKGKHTTTRREMILLPSGGILIDTPGMRELGSLADNDTLEASFEDVDFYSKDCKYRDCDHDKSDNCAVKTAVQVGTISQKRYQNYLRLKLESNKINKHEDDKKTLAKKTKQRQISRAIRSLHKGNYKNRRK